MVTMVLFVCCLPRKSGPAPSCSNLLAHSPSLAETESNPEDTDVQYGLLCCIGNLIFTNVESKYSEKLAGATCS
jgi:hypothetical protein